MNTNIRQRIREKIAHVRAERLYLRLHPEASATFAVLAVLDLRDLLTLRNL